MKLDLKLVMTSRCADGKNYIKNCLKNFWISISECCDQPEEAEAAVRFRLPHYGAGGALWHPGETLHLQVRIRIHQGLANNTIFVYFFMVKKYLQGKLISHWWEKAQFTTAFSSYLLVSISHGVAKSCKKKQREKNCDSDWTWCPLKELRTPKLKSLMFHNGLEEFFRKARQDKEMGIKFLNGGLFKVIYQVSSLTPQFSWFQRFDFEEIKGLLVERL